MTTNDHGIAEGYLAECQHENYVLHHQLALKERELQRLLTVVSELAAEVEELQAGLAEQILSIARQNMEIERLTRELGMVEAAASV